MLARVTPVPDHVHKLGIPYISEFEVFVTPPVVREEIELEYWEQDK